MQPDLNHNVQHENFNVHETSIHHLKTSYTTNEPRHAKTNKMSVRPAKTQISLRSVGSEGPKVSSCRQRKL